MQNTLTWIRSVSILLAGVMIFTLADCGAGSSDNDSTPDEAEINASSQHAEIAYEDKLFDTSYVHTINIAIAEDDWADLQKNPTAKTKYETDITIDGETIESVSFATKGNTSLTAVASDPDSDRYSFKVNFGKYVNDQTYYGLNKLSLNNIYADATYMKDYLSYEIFRQAGVESPLVSYVWLTINGEDHGLYIAIEDVSESYLDRTEDGEGELYKPETSQFENMDMGGGEMPEGEMPTMPEDMTMPEGFDQNGGGQNPPNMPDGTMPDFSDGNMPTPPGGAQQPQGGNFPGNGGQTPPDGEMPTLPEGETMPSPGEGMPGGGFGSNASGADLKYTDDNTDSYPDIFDNDETKADDDSKERVIAALKALSTGENLEDYIDTDKVIRYFAAHNFVLNYDSYTGNMLHNYYLYEKDCKLSMLPWDYNLAFGAFSMGGASSGSGATGLINTGIDTPLSASDDSSRPMWSWITSDEQYLEQYHKVYDELLSYFESGDFDTEIDRVYEMILPYVEKDPSSFYTADEYQKAYKTLKEFCHLRAESIRKQLDGSLSTKTSEQKADDQVDASAITISNMGTFNQGDNGNGDGQGQMSPPNMPGGDEAANADQSKT